MAGVTDLLDVPLYQGSSTVDNLPAEGVIAIAGRVFEIDPRQYKRDTVPILKQASNTSNEPGESALNDQGLWSRIQRDWRLASGQKYLDETDSSRQRIFASKGIDLWTAREAKLLHDVELKFAGGNYNMLVRSLGGYLYVIDGSTVQVAADPTPSSPAWSTSTTTGFVLSIATDGAWVYLAQGSGIALQRQALAGGTPVAFGAFAASVIGYGNGRLLAAAAGQIVELSSTGTYGGAGQLNWTHPNTHFIWKGIVSTPSGLYAWGDADGMSEVYVITVDPATGQLRSPVLAYGGLPGETINVLAWYSNIMAIGTTTGLRLATISNSLTLTAGAALLVPGGITDVCFDGGFAWFTWTNYDTGSTGLGRANLALMVDSANLVPASASDLLAPVQGNSLSCASHKGRRYFAIQGQGLYGEILNLVASGQIDTGWITYGTIERKAAVSIDMRHKPLAGSVSVSVVVDLDVSEGGTAVSVSTSDKAGSIGPSSPFGANNVAFERLKILFTVARSALDATAGPVLRWWALRSLPTPATTDEIVVPIRLFTRASTTRPFATPGEAFFERLEEFRYLKALEASGSIVRYQEGSTSYDVIIRGVQVRPERIAENGEWFEAIVGVHLITLASSQ